MKQPVLALLTAVLLIGVTGPPAIGDWSEADGHKMHFPQLPDELGWDVNATNPIVLADDWQCSETGWVKDIHFWGSWMHGITGEITSFNLSIHKDIPASPPDIPYSRPGETLWERVIPISDVTVLEITAQELEGWYDPANAVWLPDDHNIYYQYNVFLPEADWFPQESGTIYWLNISATVNDPALTQWGWKSSLDHWNDDAVWAAWGALDWVDLWEPPEFTQSLDLAFVITGARDTCEYYKSSYLDYAPQSMPDFDQKQDAWNDALGWTHCGPVAVANCMWWFDSKYEPNPVDPRPFASTPPNDGYPLVIDFAGTGVDDHDPSNVQPLVNQLAALMNTNGTFRGTLLSDLVAGTQQFINNAGLGSDYRDTVVAMPTYEYIRDQVLDCQDVILLLGFYEYDQLNNYYCFLGGHYVTVAGVCTTSARICWSDPYFDVLEGEPPPGSAHGSGIHNDADNISGPHSQIQHDGYGVALMPMPPPWPGPVTVVNNYPIGPPDIYQFAGLNTGVDVCPYQGGQIFTFIDDAYVICPDTTPEPTGACCYPDPANGYNSLCIVTTQDSCLNFYGGIYEGDGTGCAGTQACCLPDGSCVNADSLCCVVELGGIPQGAGTACTQPEACCLSDGSCIYVDPLCCDDLGGIPQGAGTVCTQPEACCLSDGSCIYVDPLCCDDLGGTPQGAGTACSPNTIACCLPDGSCVDVDPLCCDDLGGVPSPTGAAACLGDSDGNGIDDACEERIDTCTYYKPAYNDYAPAGMPDFDQKQDNWIYASSNAWSYCGPVALANCLWWFDSKYEASTSPPPPTVSDSYNLLWAFGAWDDHDAQNVMPFVDSLALYCNTNTAGSGTSVWDLAQGAEDWMVNAGLGGDYTVRVFSVEPGVFGIDEIKAEVLASQDVILLIGFYQDPGGGYCEWVGGHFLTIAGVCTDPADSTICVSDPFYDKNEGGPPPPHGSGVHNDAQFVSGPHGTMHHDSYDVVPTTCQFTAPPFFHLELMNYPISVPDLGNFYGQNRHVAGIDPIPPQPGTPIHVVIQYAVVICPDTTPEPTGACCYENPAGEYALCTETTQDSCINVLGGIYQGDGTVCAGQQACCLPGGACIDADSICCVNELGGIPQGPGTVCGALQACCMPDNSCLELDSLCCLEIGGIPLGTGTHCTAPEACCYQDGSCHMLDPLCCINIGGAPQGTGTSCSAATVACCLPTGGCVDMDPLCCDDIGGTPSPWGAAACMGDGNANGIDDACEIDTCTYYKPSFPDYAPFSVPDFDQKQDAWISPVTGNWSWCGPVALANCMWWFDSKFENPASPSPPTISDSYPLISAYGSWDDHDPNNTVPFIQALAPTCNTDVFAPGTVLWDLEAGFQTWLANNGLAGQYTTYVKLGPEFLEVRDSVLACQDVILLLGFYELIPGGDCQWLGGHYVTAAGTCEEDFAICVSDPYFDKNEGEPPLGAHGPTVHNDAQNVSGPHNQYHHDKYHLAPLGMPAPCPLSPATWQFTDYPNNWADIMVFENENPIDPVAPVTYFGNDIIVLLDAALIICPVEECDCMPGDANNDGTYNVGDAVYIVNYVFKGGPPPAPYRICSGDADCNCAVNVADGVYIINYVFKGGPPPCDCQTWLSICGPPLRE